MLLPLLTGKRHLYRLRNQQSGCLSWGPERGLL